VSRREYILTWVLVIVACILTLYMLRAILLPFVVGFAVAYLLDPSADRLEAAGLSRTWATGVITAVFFGLVVLILLVLYPLLEIQVSGFLARAPEYAERIRGIALPFLEGRIPGLESGELDGMRGVAADFAKQSVAWLGDALGNLWRGGLALFNFFSLIFVTPVVAFYLIRDWDRIVAKIDALLPRRNAGVIREQMRQIDEALSGFVRGQGSVALVLGVLFAVGWSLAGLEFGLLIGLGAGLLAFIPYVGAVIGFGTAFIVGLVQFGFDPVHLGLITGVFVIGQTLDGLFLTPHLVGGRIGLHPVWVMFALMAGGALFGFVGIFLAVPAAAVIAVLVRFGIERYHNSNAYLGAGDSET
tara:strand:- start:8446 stop:9519 length:1074 start_codon:yes stop_codon:yes gene_type:complete